jgi:hypothetical protein
MYGTVVVAPQCHVVVPWFGSPVTVRVTVTEGSADGGDDDDVAGGLFALGSSTAFTVGPPVMRRGHRDIVGPLQVGPHATHTSLLAAAAAWRQRVCDRGCAADGPGAALVDGVCSALGDAWAGRPFGWQGACTAAYPCALAARGAAVVVGGGVGGIVYAVVGRTLMCLVVTVRIVPGLPVQVCW